MNPDGTTGQRRECSVVMLGATGAVGGQVVATLSDVPEVTRLTLLGRRAVVGLDAARVTQHVIDPAEPANYERFLAGHSTAICTLGVGQPSKVSREEFVRVDHDLVLAFARACRRQGVRHFELLGSVGADPGSRSFYLRTKGRLEEGLRSLEFERLSLFRPSMILTPANRYGASQAILLAVMPWVGPLLVGSWRRYRGVRVEDLGRAIARNATTRGVGVEVIEWDGLQRLSGA